MKKLFYLGAIGCLLFEIANVYFIMPMPGGSQEIESIGLAYFLYRWRWAFRAIFGLFLLAGLKNAWQGSRWLPVASLLAVAAIAWVVNFQMSADTMFYQPGVVNMADTSSNRIPGEKLVLGVCYNGAAKAYPIQFLGYHHQVRDSIGGKPIMVTYCTVCRTGRVYEPVVGNRTEHFRLVGMDHFNAMFEDATTKSWWQQATGEAVAGPLKGSLLPEFPSMQTTLDQWIALYPNTLVMQGDPDFQTAYDSMLTYEGGKRNSKLTRRDTASWQPKSWVVGLTLGKASKAYDWNELQARQLIHDTLGGQAILLALAPDRHSFAAFERVSADQLFSLQGDTLVCEGKRFRFNGASTDPSQPDLKKVDAYQEYWHSWKTFHPATRQ